MTEHEVEVEREKVVTEVEIDAFVLCDLCMSELEPGEEIRFYSAHEDIGAIDLCGSCLDGGPESVASAVSYSHSKSRNHSPEPRVSGKLLVIVVSTLVLGMFLGALL